ncbi:cyclin-L1-like isoform X2 [Tubulanus polymorphus]|uniref:cyclin-L1-like isoform X2 n=1 Tax=Tubulanus polymorphus TaxID=672921 RepID=UPI003DA3BBED
MAATDLLKSTGPTLKRDFSRVILTLDNVLIPAEKLQPTPSMNDGLDTEIEIDLRILGCELIQTAGILLKLPQVAMATGQVIFQRFYYSKSFVKHNMEVVAMACINLASKIEESPRRMRDVMNVFHHIKQVRSQKKIHPLILDSNYINLKNQVIKAERRLLKELGFCVHVKHPHKIIVMFLQVLECEQNQGLVQLAWNYMNDSLRSNVFVRYPPETIACACIHLAARQIQMPLPSNPPWYAIFDADETDITEICLTILRLYSRAKPNMDLLEKAVNDIKKIQSEAKMKMKSDGTPSSQPDTPQKNYGSSPVSNAGVKRIKDEDEHSNSSFGANLKPHHRENNKKRRSRSRSYTSRSGSRSYSRSPSPKRNKRRSPSSRKHHKKSTTSSTNRRSKDRYPLKEKHKRHHSSYSKSRSRSPTYSPDGGRGGGSHKKYYKEKVSKYDGMGGAGVRSRSPAFEKRKSKKHNGHGGDRSKDRYSNRR